MSGRARVALGLDYYQIPCTATAFVFATLIVTHSLPIPIDVLASMAISPLTLPRTANLMAGTSSASDVTF